MPMPQILRLAFTRRYGLYAVVLVATLILLLLSLAHSYFLPFFIVALALAAVGTHDIRQTHHSLRRNYPIAAHIRDRKSTRLNSSHRR